MTTENKFATRLDRLPPKTRRIFQDLYDIGHIDDQSLEVVLTAGELTGETHRLVSFAVSYLVMKSKGIPVADVLHMAKQHQYRVNLWWSHWRWQEVHNLLARASTLKALATFNTQYQTDEIRNLLPKSFPGYLIRSSRRLGMEGLRQRHTKAA